MSAFPRTLDYTVPPLAISARAYTCVAVPESSGNARPGAISRIRLPSGRSGTYLNQAKSFLAFDVRNTSVLNGEAYSVTYTPYGGQPTTVRNIRAPQLAKLYLDGSAYACIETLEVYNSSNLLESIAQYNILATIFMDLQMSMSCRATSATILGMGNTGACSTFYQFWRGATSNNNTSLNQNGTNNAIFNEEYMTASAMSGKLSAGAQGMPNLYAAINILSANDIDDINPSPPSAATTADVQTTTNSYRILVGQSDPTAPANLADPVDGFASYLGPVMPDIPVNWNIVGANYSSYNVNGNVLTPNLYGSAVADTGANQLSSFISRLGPVIAFGQSMRFCLPLISGVIGTLSTKCLPIGQLNSDLLINITWSSNEVASCIGWLPTHWCPNPDTSCWEAGVLNNEWRSAFMIQGSNELCTKQYEIENIEYHANYIEISANAQSMIDQATGGNYTIPSCSYRNFTNQVEGGQSNVEFMIPARFTSVKSIIGCMRPSQDITNSNSFSVSGRVKNWYTRLQLRVGSLLLPQQPIRMENLSRNVDVLNPLLTAESLTAGQGSAPEAFCHLLESIGQSASDLDIECCMDDQIYGANTTMTSTNPLNSDSQFYLATAQGSKSGFVWGIDLESFSGQQQTGPMQSGSNTLGLNIFCRLWKHSQVANTGQSVPDTAHVSMALSSWAYFDQVLVLQAGVLSVRF